MGFFGKKTLKTTKGQIEIDDEGLTYLIDKHCRESGVRNLQKKIQRIFRKSAIQGKNCYFYKMEISNELHYRWFITYDSCCISYLLK